MSLRRKSGRTITELQLDQAIEQSFPASDPLAPTQPAADIVDPEAAKHKDEGQEAEEEDEEAEDREAVAEAHQESALRKNPAYSGTQLEVSNHAPDTATVVPPEQPVQHPPPEVPSPERPHQPQFPAPIARRGS